MKSITKFPKTPYVKLNCLRTGVGRFRLSLLQKWGLNRSSSNYLCGATAKTNSRLDLYAPYDKHYMEHNTDDFG